MLFVLSGTFSAAAVGFYLEKTKKFTRTLKMIGFNSTILMFSALWMLPTDTLWAVIVFSVVGGAVIVPIVPVSYILATEVTHPI